MKGEEEEGAFFLRSFFFRNPFVYFLTSHSTKKQDQHAIKHKYLWMAPKEGALSSPLSRWAGLAGVQMPMALFWRWSINFPTAVLQYYVATDTLDTRSRQRPIKEKENGVLGMEVRNMTHKRGKRRKHVQLWFSLTKEKICSRELTVRKLGEPVGILNDEYDWRRCT